MNYYNKYIKYKNKYLSLKNQFGGSLLIKSYNELKNNILEKLSSENNFVLNYKLYYEKKIDKVDNIIKDLTNKKQSQFNIDKKLREDKIESLNHTIFSNKELKEGYIREIVTTNVLSNEINIEKQIKVLNNAKIKYQDIIKKITIDFLKENFTNMFNKMDIMKGDELDKVRIGILENILEMNYTPLNLNDFGILNYFIIGNPGIGKSYNARLIADILKASLLILGGEIINIKKPDVIGQYIGQTTPKTYIKLLEGIENIIFIDEAYSFAGKKTDSGYDRFGQEFIDALTDFSSEYVGLISFIVAGYKTEMKTQFLDVNIGLERRFPNKINLARFNGETLFKIFKSLYDKTILKDDRDEILNRIKQGFLSLYNTMSFDLEDLNEKIIYNNKIDFYICGKSDSDLNLEHIIIDDTKYYILLNLNKLDHILPNIGNNYYKNFIKAFIINSEFNITDGDIFSYQSDDMNKLLKIIRGNSILSNTEDEESYLYNIYRKKYSYMGNVAEQYFKTKTIARNIKFILESDIIHNQIILTWNNSSFSNKLLNLVTSVDSLDSLDNNYTNIIKNVLNNAKEKLNEILKLEDTSNRPYQLYSMEQLKTIKIEILEFEKILKSSILNFNIKNISIKNTFKNGLSFDLHKKVQESITAAGKKTDSGLVLVSQYSTEIPPIEVPPDFPTDKSLGNIINEPASTDFPVPILVPSGAGAAGAADVIEGKGEEDTAESEFSDLDPLLLALPPPPPPLQLVREYGSDVDRVKYFNGYQDAINNKIKFIITTCSEFDYGDEKLEFTDKTVKNIKIIDKIKNKNVYIKFNSSPEPVCISGKLIDIDTVNNYVLFENKPGEILGIKFSGIKAITEIF